MFKKNSFQRNVIAIAICFVVTMFSGCGKGNVKYEENEILGKFPSLFIEKYRLLNELKEEMRNKMRSGVSEAKANELQKQWIEREEAIKQQTQELALAEWEKLRAVEVPFRFDYDDPDFKILSAMIEETDEKTGALTVNLLFEAKHDMQPSMNTALKYNIVDKEGNVLFSGTINPFVNIQIISRGHFRNVPDQIKAGEYCCQKGSKLMLYCSSYDFTKFAEIVFFK